jgi:hypothetical protein
MAVKRGIKVTYFDGRGRAEVLRFALGGAGVYFENVLIKDRYAMEELLASDKLKYGQVPLLETASGMCLVQGGAQLRWIAREFGLYGENNNEAAQIDMIVEGA